MRDARAAHGLPTEIVHQPNPRVELEGHYYNAKHQHLLDLGLQPHALADTLIEDVIHVVERHASRVRPHTLVTAVDWRKGGEVYGPPPTAPGVARARRRRGAEAEPVAAPAGALISASAGSERRIVQRKTMQLLDGPCDGARARPGAATGAARVVRHRVLRDAPARVASLVVQLGVDQRAAGVAAARNRAPRGASPSWRSRCRGRAAGTAPG